ncbi:FUSC family protein [Streptomyces sp. NPDC101234]|uniref:FUSC family protein n=1 Tax=Streptomyces sp. NPDC101234 TaxID=3366138 RepID=UPI00380077DB
MRLVDQVIWLESILKRSASDPGPGPTDDVVTRVKLAAADVLDHAGEVMEFGRHDAAGLHADLQMAVLVVKLWDVQHSSWVVLGAMAVLRSNALNTGQNVLRAAAGTVVGMGGGGAVVHLLGGHTVALWLMLPIVVFFGAMAPDVISFAAGQAGFTATLLILYNIVEPAGWQIGIVRIEDVAIGCAVSLVVGVLFWPRGAAGALSQSLSEALVDAARYLGATVDYGVSRCDRVRPALLPPVVEARRAAAASRRLDDALRNYLAERGAKHLALADLASLINAVAVLRLTGDAVLDLWSSVGPRPGGDRSQARREVRGSGGRLVAWFEQAAGALLGTDEPPPPAAPDGSADARLIAALDGDLHGEEEGARRLRCG